MCYEAGRLLRHAPRVPGRDVVDHDAQQWIAAPRFTKPALQSTFGSTGRVLAARDGEMAAIEAELMPWYRRDPVADAVTRLACYRGIAELTALTLAAEVIDWRRFATAGAFMGFTSRPPPPPLPLTAAPSTGEASRHTTAPGVTPTGGPGGP